MRCVSLFSGCGGLDLGLSKAGFKTILAVDNNPHCAASYLSNFPSTPFFVGSVGELDEVLLTALSRGETRRGVDLLAGGPPCPPYSKSRFYRKEKPRALADELGQETIEGYLAVLKAIRPRAFLLENVPGMAYKVHRPALELIQGVAHDLGYNCTSEVINAANFGVPQIRERFFMVGTLHGMFRFPSPTHKQPQNGQLFSHNEGLSAWRTAGEAIADLDTEENADDAGHFAGGRFHDLLTLVPPGENYLFFTKERGHASPKFKWRSRYWSFLLKLSPSLPAWTIQARRSNNMGPFHWRNRILRVAEIKRLQTFPDDWQLCGRTEYQWRQVGNAVPPLLAYHLGTALFDHLGSTKKLAGVHTGDTRLTKPKTKVIASNRE